MRTLILTLPPDAIDATTRLAYVCTVDGQVVSGQDAVTIDLLPTDVDDVVAVVPATLLSWHRVRLPAGSVPRGLRGERAMARLRAILGGLLEDELLDDPTDMHLALAPSAINDAPVWVSACHRAWLIAALAALAQAGHPVNRVVPELSPQTLAGSVLVAGDSHAPWVAGVVRGTSQFAGSNNGGSGNATRDNDADEDCGLLVCPLNPAALAQLGALAHAHEAAALPALLAEPAVAAQAERLCQRPAVLQPRAQRLLLAAQSDWNLAQFELAGLGRNQRWMGVLTAVQSFVSAPAWRAARLALALLLVVNLIGLNAFALREKALLADQREAVRAVLRETFVNTTVIVDAPLQMAREVAALQRHSSRLAQADLERMLAVLADAPTAVALDSIDYEANQLRVGAVALGDSQALATHLAAQGLRTVTQGTQWRITAGAKP